MRHPLGLDFPVLMPDVIAHNARIHGDRTAIVCGDERLTWREADERRRPTVTR
jgi:acyl-CoA synthetase (AMP-forming)/AMP-acid ligase II